VIFFNSFRANAENIMLKAESNKIQISKISCLPEWYRRVYCFGGLPKIFNSFRANAENIMLKAESNKIQISKISLFTAF